MPTFLLTYRLPNDHVTGSEENAPAWMAFFDGLADRLVELGRPVFETRALADCGDGTRLGGYSIIEADDIDAAATAAKSCPAFDLGGGVEVGRLATVVDGRVVLEG